MVALLAGALAFEAPALGVEARAAEERTTELEAELPTAPVVIDGKVLFRVRGTSAFPADRRAAGIAERLAALAADPTVSADAVHPVETDIGTAIVADRHRVMVVVDSDARWNPCRARCSRTSSRAPFARPWWITGTRAAGRC
jgi:hypothetical protein